ncbi:MAG: PD-(D/E)XK nuclease family protein [Spirochaetes bacterium]|nr:PD-(D/E)XK nuclease family protein [Spirochaetota bacterium]
MNVELIAPGADLVSAIADRIVDRSADRGALRDALVLLPGKRIGHFLRRELARRVGTAFAPPRIVTLGDLVDELFDRWNEGRLPLARPIDAVALLHDVQVAADRPLGGSSFMSLDDFLPLGLRIFEAVEELLIEGVAADAVGGVQALIEEGVPAAARERLATLRSFYDALYPAIAAAGLSTRSSRIRAVAERLAAGDFAPYQVVVAAGFVELRAAERRILTVVGSLPTATLLLRDGPGLAPLLEALGAPRAAARKPRRQDGAPPAREGSSDAARRPEVHFHRSPDAHGQVFELAGLLQTPDPRAVVVLPSPDTLFPLLNHCLSRFDGRMDYNVSLQYPLTRTPLAGFFADLMQLAGSMQAGRVYVPDYLAFLLHPYTKNALLDGRAETNRVLLHRVEERLAETGGRAFVTLAEIESDRRLFEQAAEALGAEGPGPERLAGHLTAIHRDTLGRFQRFADVREFIDRCIDLVEWVHERTTARSHPYFTPFAEHFLEALADIRGSLLADRVFEGTAGYFGLLRRYLASREVPFDGTPLHGLQVLGLLETRGLGFERVFVLDANEGLLPAVPRDDPLLPLPVRRALGLPTPRDRELAARHHFEELASGCRELHLFSVYDGKAEPSRFVERLLWERQREDRILDAESLVTPVHYRMSLVTPPPGPVAKTPEVSARLPAMSFSASSLDAYLACPLRFYHSRVLGLREKDEATGEVDRLGIGMLVHEAITGFLAPHCGTPAIEPGSLDAREMDQVAVDRFRARFGDPGAGPLRLIADQVRRQLGRFVDGWLRPMAERTRLSVTGLEQEIEATWQDRLLKGRLDAVFDRDGRPWIVDWKTGHKTDRILGQHADLIPGDRSTWQAGLGSTQLPLYLLLHAAQEGRHALAADAAFVMLGRSRLDAEAEAPLFGDRDQAATLWPRIEETLRRLIDEILDPSVPFAPAEDLAAACRYCPYTTICGTGGLAIREESR